MKTVPLVSLLTLGLCHGLFAKVVYVDDNASVGGDGTSWANAYKYLQDALADVNASDEIWVAEGTYKPDQGAGKAAGDRTATFSLVNGIDMYGGFIGSESSREPLGDVNQTILSGEIDEDSELWSLHVVSCINLTNYSVSGFVITKGNANDSNGGGGVFGLRGTFTNCAFTNNSATNGGAVYGIGTFTDCTFANNSATNGGAVYGQGTFTNCTFNNNSATNNGGGAHGRGPFTNCTFNNNSATNGGAAYGIGDFTNCTFNNNSATNNGGALRGIGTSKNCTFNNNSAAIGGAAYGIGDFPGSSFVTKSDTIVGDPYPFEVSVEVDLGDFPRPSPAEAFLTVTATTGGSVSGGGGAIKGSSVVLTATPSNEGYVFGEWSGDANGTTNPLTIMVDANKTITANFAQDLSDDDGDGLSNYSELVTHGTDKTKADTDGDGLGDKVELDAGGDPKTSDAAYIDAVLKHYIDAGQQPGATSSSTPYTDGWHYYPNRGWMYTKRSIYPYFYDSSTKAWMYFRSGEDKPRFYHYGTKAWVTLGE